MRGHGSYNVSRDKYEEAGFKANHPIAMHLKAYGPTLTKFGMLGALLRATIDPSWPRSHIEVLSKFNGGALVPLRSRFEVLE